MRPVILWFRRDLRIRDNAALAHAARLGVPILPLFIFDTDLIEALPSDGAAFDFQAECLHDLSRSLASLGGRLIVRHGRVLEVHETVIRHYQPSALYFNRDYEPSARARDSAVERLYRSFGIDIRSFKDHVLQEPDELLSAAGTPYVVFTPYATTWKRNPIAAPYETPVRILTPPGESGRIAGALDLGRTVDVRERGIRGGESAAMSAWQKFRDEGLEAYDVNRNNLGKNGTSRLSPYLRFGCISARALVEDCRRNDQSGSGSEKFINELVWRDFYQSLMFHFPNLAHESYRTGYDAIRRKKDGKLLERWKAGRTGYPLVDAGMRELNRTGWMHNRVRMVVASFLTKDLLQHWHEGARYFEEKLLDIETASNAGGWQWAAGAGVDPKPLRIFNPTLQARRFDPEGDYIRRHVPELASVPTKYIHEPSLMSPALQKEVGCVIGKDYPSPLVDHAEAARSFRLLSLERGRLTS